VTDRLIDQLCRYGDALEDHLVSTHPAAVASTPTTHPRRRQLLAAAAVVLVVGVAVGVGVVTRHKHNALPVSTHPGVVTSTTATVVGDTTPTTDGSPSTTTVAGDLTPTTDGSPSITTVVGSPTTTAGVAESHVRGYADWLGRDQRGELYVAACPSNDTGPACPSTRVTPVADDGSFDLTLPSVPEGTTWRVAAYVDVEHVSWPQCVFSCVWPTRPLNVVRGDVTDIEANVDQTLALSVSARVVDVYVRDRNGQPFQGPGEGVQVTDARCQGDPCPEDQVPMFMQASSPDGATRLVVNPDIRYDLHGQAMNMRSQGWGGDPWTHDGNEFWFSPDEVMLGSQLDEGHVFYVDGAPTDSSSSS